MNSKQCEAGWSCQDFSSKELRACSLGKIRPNDFTKFFSTRLEDHVFSSYLLSTLSYGKETGKTGNRVWHKNYAKNTNIDLIIIFQSDSRKTPKRKAYMMMDLACRFDGWRRAAVVAFKRRLRDQPHAQWAKKILFRKYNLRCVNLVELSNLKNLSLSLSHTLTLESHNYYLLKNKRNE